jgi:hypothetical protein
MTDIKSKYYYIENNALWFIAKCADKKEAKEEAKKEFGILGVVTIRIAKPDEIKRYKKLRPGEFE